MKIEEMISNNRGDCCGCESCANTCPKNAIKMIRDAEGFAYPKINHEICIECGKCDLSCPSLNFHENKIAKLPKVFVAINPDEKVRRHSSSGGFFSAVSEIILNDGGIIFGAGFDENWRVKHMSAENSDELDNLRRSKYVQSQIGDTYKNIKKFLESGRKVLFSGTACQCAGLKKFLGRDFDNLLTLAVICHGTPSPMVWESYIDWRGQGHEITHVNFRHKPHWFKITYKDRGYYTNNMEDFYLQCFLLNIILRPACHSCKFRFPNNFSDITCGDAWGIENFAPEMNDNRGVSVVIIHTDKGAKFFDKADLKVKQVGFGIFSATLPWFLIPTLKNSRREKFFADMAKLQNPVAALQKILMENPPVNMKSFLKTWYYYKGLLHLCKLPNPVSTMQKVLLNDPDTEENNFRMQLVENRNNKIRKIFESIAQNRERNILIITSDWQEHFKNMIIENLFADAKNFGMIIANICDNFFIGYDLENKNFMLQIPTDSQEIKNFLDSCNVTDIFVIEPLEFDKNILSELLSSYSDKVKFLTAQIS